MQEKELEYTINYLKTEIDRLKIELDFIKNPDRKEWMLIEEFATYSRGKYSVKELKQIIKQSVDFPWSSNIRQGIDFDFVGKKIKINIDSFSKNIAKPLS